jgi:hypothetical protein
VNLLNLIVYGPLGGAQVRRPKVIHAITVESAAPGLRMARPGHPRCVEAACGAKNIRFVSDRHGSVLLWPIRARGDFERCPACWEATGKKRPRTASHSASYSEQA